MNYQEKSSEPKKIVDASKLEVKNKFLSHYVDSVSRVTDAPKDFLFFSGVSLLSGILNKFYFLYPSKIHLNLFTLLLAPSTFYRKSTCCSIAEDYLYEVDSTLVFPQSFTAEALFKIAQQYSRGLIFWSELNVVKNFVLGKAYSKGVSDLLIDIYDCKKYLKRYLATKGEVIVETPIVSILAAGISDWFIRNLKAVDFMGGLWSRFLFVITPEEERKFTFPKEFKPDQKIVSWLKDLNELEARKIDWAKVRPMMKEWGSKHMKEAQDQSMVMSAMYQRLEVMLLKLASILQISHDKSFSITPETFSEAIRVIEYVKAQLPAFFLDEVHFSELEKAMSAIVRFLRKRKRPCLKKEILQGVKIGKKQTDPALEQLLEEERIRMTTKPTPERGGRVGTLYEYIEKTEYD